MTSPTAELAPSARPALEVDLQLAPAPLVLAGELDAAATERLRALLDDRVATGCRLEVDLAGVSHLSAAALAVLVSTHRKQRDRAGVLVLCAPSPAVQRVLRVSGLHRVFATSPD